MPPRKKVVAQPHAAKKTPQKTPSRALPGSVQKKHRFRPGTVALREIRKFQRTSDLLLRKLPFARLVREISNTMAMNLRWQGQALLALQEAAEAYLTHLFEDTYVMKVAANPHSRGLSPGAMRCVCMHVCARVGRCGAAGNCVRCTRSG